MSLRERPTLDVAPGRCASGVLRSPGVRPLRRAIARHRDDGREGARGLPALEGPRPVRPVPICPTPFDGELLRRLAVLKLWQTRDPFEPEVLSRYPAAAELPKGPTSSAWCGRPIAFHRGRHHVALRVRSASSWGWFTPARAGGHRRRQEWLERTPCPFGAVSNHPFSSGRAHALAACSDSLKHTVQPHPFQLLLLGARSRQPEQPPAAAGRARCDKNRGPGAPHVNKRQPSRST